MVSLIYLWFIFDLENKLIDANKEESNNDESNIIELNKEISTNLITLARNNGTLNSATTDTIPADTFNNTQDSKRNELVINSIFNNSYCKSARPQLNWIHKIDNFAKDFVPYLHTKPHAISQVPPNLFFEFQKSSCKLENIHDETTLNKILNRIYLQEPKDSLHLYQDEIESTYWSTTQNNHLGILKLTL